MDAFLGSGNPDSFLIKSLLQKYSTNTLGALYMGSEIDCGSKVSKST